MELQTNNKLIKYCVSNFNVLKKHILFKIYNNMIYIALRLHASN